MKLFGNKNKGMLPPRLTSGMLHSADDNNIEFSPEPLSYEVVLEYLQGLSDEDYAKIIEVTGIVRKADQKVAKALGIKTEAATFINTPTPRLVAPGSFLDDEPVFLDIDPKPKTSKKTKDK